MRFTCATLCHYYWGLVIVLFSIVIVPLCVLYSVGHNCHLTEWTTGNSCIIPISKCSTKTGSKVICYQSGISSYSFWNTAASAINIDWSKNHPLQYMYYTRCYLALPFRMLVIQKLVFAETVTLQHITLIYVKLLAVI